MTSTDKYGDEFLVNTTTTGSQNGSTVTPLSNGGFVVAWQDSSDGTSIRAQIYDATGSASGDEFGGDEFVLEGDTTSYTRPSVTELEDGDLVIAAVRAGNSDDVVFQRYTSDGTASGALTTANAENDADYANVTALTDGGFVVAWSDDSETGDDVSDDAVRAKVYDADDTVRVEEFVVNTTTDDIQNAPMPDWPTAGLWLLGGSERD